MVDSNELLWERVLPGSIVTGGTSVAIQRGPAGLEGCYMMARGVDGAFNPER